jgi:hypothetical protein
MRLYIFSAALTLLFVVSFYLRFYQQFAVSDKSEPYLTEHQVDKVFYPTSWKSIPQEQNIWVSETI